MSQRPNPLLTTDALAERLQKALGEQYLLERELGGGGMSRVFVAHHVKLARSVVVKVLHEELAESLSHDRFRREVMLSAGLQHPHIVGVLDAGEAGNLPYFVMPYVEGESLRTRLARDGPLSIPQAVSILRDVARALAFAHARRIVHRDIKPDNVLLAHGSALVADFGVAKAVQSARSEARGPRPAAGGGAAELPVLTSVGTTLGTPAYMAPEQVAGDPDTDHRADLYALGATAYEMITGRIPHSGRTPAELLTAKLTEAPSPPSQFRAGIPLALEDLIRRCLARNPDDRPSTADEVVALLENPSVVSGAVASHEVALARALNGSRRNRSLLVAAALVAVAGLGAWLATRDRGEGASPPAAGAASAARSPTVAVLPLVSISPDSSDGYIALGMTDELTSALSRVRGLRVASRSAAGAVQAEGLTVQEMAGRLGVAFLLEGTVQREGTRLRVTVRLVNGSDGFTAWSNLYERTTDDLLDVQSEIAREIAEAIRGDVAAGADSGPAVSVSGTTDLDAYNDYLRGRFLLERRGDEGLRQAALAFRSAIARDSGFARAWAELAQTYAVMPLHGTVVRESVWPQAVSAAQRALALDSTLAPAHAALGVIYNGELRWAEGRTELERAIRLDSSYTPALQWLGENALANGDLDLAVRMFGRAERRDPSSAIIGAVHALALGVRGEIDSAIAKGRAAVSRDPALMASRLMLGTIYLYAGRPEDAVRELEAARAAAPDAPIVMGTLGYAHARAGNRARALALADSLASDTSSGSRAGVWSALAKVRLGLGDTRGALDALERALAARDPFFAS
ncbi:MAG TPA: protein kinase, partial [Gemmatimonadaceae bacterium]|nr:protein kinase [Gemmatimonadaceae bacterium]